MMEGNSMSPALQFGDLVVLTPPPKSIPSGTIVTMEVPGYSTALVTHRLIAGYSSGIPKTKGDANSLPDNFEGSNVRIVGVVRLRIPWLGYPILYLRYSVRYFVNQVFA
jgi:signal peptidase